jgi:hypothetical protein
MIECERHIGYTAPDVPRYLDSRVSAAPAPSSRERTSDFGQAAKGWIAKHLYLTLAIGVTVGVGLGWLVKRK